MRGLKTIVSRQEATIKAQTAVISNLVDTVSRQGAQIARLEGNKSPNTSPSDPTSNNTLGGTKCKIVANILSVKCQHHLFALFITQDIY